MTATIESSGRTIQVKLRNLSAEGAQVEAAELPVEGTEVLFRKGDLAVVGTLVWTKGKQAGIRFADKLKPDAVLNHIPAPRPRVQAEFRRPGLGSRELTAQERKLAESWITISPITPPGD